MASLEEITTNALDGIVRGDGEGFLVLMDLIEPQVRAYYRRHDFGRRFEFEPDDLVHDVMLRVRDAWERTAAEVHRPTHWVRRVATIVCCDVHRRRTRSPTVLSLEAASDCRDESHRPGSVSKRMSRLVARLVQQLPEDGRRILYLMRSRNFSQTRAARRIIEAERIPAGFEAELDPRVAGDPVFIEALGLGLGIRDAALLSFDDDEWSELLGRLEIERATRAEIDAMKPFVGNRFRGCRFRIHQWESNLLPADPPELRQIWDARWSNQAKAPIGYFEASQKLSISEETARRCYEIVQLHVQSPCRWSNDARQVVAR